jgi:hypothetical protein
MDATVTVVMSGTLFTGAAEHIVDLILDDAAHEIAQQGYSDVMTNLNRSIRNPTPYYETQVVVDGAPDGYVVHDRGIIYGPWLEGVSTRNQQTRFKGYASFRRGFQKLTGEVPKLLDHVIGRHIGKLS